MIGPLRRSIAERLLTANSTPCTVCYRRIHVNNVLRGAAAAAQAQTSSQIPVILPENLPQKLNTKAQQTPTKQSKQSKTEKQVKQVKQQVKQVNTNTKSSKNVPKPKQASQPKAQEFKLEANPVGDPLETAGELKSPFPWGSKEIYQLYTSPTEEEVPSRLKISYKKRGGGTVKQTYEWKREPLRYLEDGLKLSLKMQRLNLSEGTRVKLIARWGDVIHTVIGDGKDQETAANNAALHLIMREKNSTLFSYPLIVIKCSVTADINTVEKSSKVDVYDYAAQFDTLPVFDIIRIPKVAATDGARNGFYCRITVKGTSIIGEAYNATSLAAAELGACINFKKRAEELHQGETMFVKHINTLTSSTGEKFLQYCKLTQKDWEQYNFVAKSVGPVVQGSLHLGTRLLSECTMYNRSDAEAICYYLAARDMKAQDEKLWKDFVVYINEHHGQILKPIHPLGVWMNQETIGALRNRLQRLTELDRELQAFSKIQQNLSDEVDQEDNHLPLAQSRNRHLTPDETSKKSLQLSQRLTNYEESPGMENMRNVRAELPLNVHAEEVKTLFSNNDVCVLVGATGSGKTTQVPQFLLDQYIREGRGAECNIICTQPRRIAAISVAERVANERGEDVGQSVGYQVRFAARTPQYGGSITYCTTGILLRQLQDGWESLRGISHVIVDEVHERDVQIDFLLVILRRILEARRRGDPSAPPIKVILMSATIDTTLFRKYFGAAYDSGECPFIEIPGRMYPVEKYFLDDIQTILSQYPSAKQDLEKNMIAKKYITHEQAARRDIARALQEEKEEEEATGIDWSRTGSAWEEDMIDMGQNDTDQPDVIIANLIAHLCTKKDEGAVLVFLPGFKEIVSLNNLLKSTRLLGEDFSDSSKYRIFMLHSSIPTMQQDVFAPLPKGIRKIILSTNIAETSVTIPEVVYVVDTCKHREKRYSQLRRSTALVCTWISQSSSRQRLGRAGRVKAGEYYALCYPERHTALPAGDVPEIKRSDLQGICLSVRAYGIQDPIADVLEECIQPPSSLAIVSALKRLSNLGALDNNEKLTPLGQILVQFPVEPALAKMVLLGTMFKCIDPILILASIESNRSFFLTPPGAVDQNTEIRRAMSLGQPSDHLALLNAFREWRFIKSTRGRSAANEYAYSHLMHVGGLQTIEKTAEQMLGMLVDWKLAKDIPAGQRYNCELGDPELNINSDVQPLVFSLLTAGLVPNLAVQMSPILLQTTSDAKAMIHPGSLNAGGGGDRSKKDRYLGAGPPGTLVLFSSKNITGGGVFLRDTTIIGPMTGLMFHGKLTSRNHENILYIDDWLPMKFESGVSRNVLQLTQCLENFLNRTWSRLKVHKTKGRFRTDGDTVSFFDADPSRDPMVKSIVEILERAEHLEKLRRKLEDQEWNTKRSRSSC